MERVDDSVVVEVKTVEEMSLNEVAVYDAVVVSPGSGMLLMLRCCQKF